MKNINIEKEVVEMILPPMIQLLLDENKITEKVSFEELNYCINELLKTNIIEDARVHIIISNETYKLFKELYKKENYDMAIIIGATFIEQITNEFYQHFLISEKKLTESEIYTCLRSIPVREKFGWFYKQSFNEDFNKKLYRFIDKLFSRRNTLIHNIPEIKTFDEIENEKEVFDNKKLKENIDLIVNELNKKEKNIHKNLTIAKRIFDKYYN